MELIKYIILSWLIVFRFVMFPSNLILDFTSILLSVWILNNSKSVIMDLLALISLLVNLSDFFTTVGGGIGLPFTQILGSIAAIITLIIAFNPLSYGMD